MHSAERKKGAKGQWRPCRWENIWEKLRQRQYIISREKRKITKMTANYFLKCQWEWATTWWWTTTKWKTDKDEKLWSENQKWVSYSLKELHNHVFFSPFKFCLNVLQLPLLIISPSIHSVRTSHLQIDTSPNQWWSVYHLGFWLFCMFTLRSSVFKKHSCLASLYLTRTKAAERKSLWGRKDMSEKYRWKR